MALAISAEIIQFKTVKIEPPRLESQVTGAIKSESDKLLNWELR